MGFFHSTIDTVTDGHSATLAMDSKRNLFNVIRDAAGNARGVNVNSSNQLSVSVDNTSVITGSGTAGSAASGVVTVQGIASMTALKVDASGVAVPVTDNSGSLTVDNSGTFAVQAAQSGTWTVQPGNTANTTAWLVAGGKTNNNAAPGATNLGTLSALANASTPSWTEGNLVALSTDLAGNLRVIGGGGTQYTEDTASAGGEALTLAGAVRRDTAASSSGTDGDYATINTDSSGKLWVNDIARTEVTGTASGTGVLTNFPVDCANYSWVSIQGTGTWTAGVVFEVSDDNSTWSSLSLQTPPGFGSYSGNLNNVTGPYYGPIGARYFRVRCTTYTSGTIGCIAEFSSAAGANTIMRVTSFTTLDVDWPALNKTTLADATTNPQLAPIQNFSMLYNNSTWDRTRSVINATNSTGTGIQAVGNLAQFDDTSPTSITENQFGNLRMSANRNLYNTIRDAAGNERGANVTSSNELLVNVNNAVPVTDNSGSLTVDAPVATPVFVRLSDGSNAIATLPVSQSGTWTVQPGNTANTTAWLMTQVPATTGGLTTFHLVSAATTNATNVKASAGQVFGWFIYNSNAARKVAFHNTSGTPTAGSSIFYSLVIPTSGANVEFTNGVAFSSGIGITTVTGLADSDSAAVAANDLIINVFYK